LRHILAFVGLTDATFIHAENQKPGELGESSRAAAIAQIQEAAVEQSAAAVLPWRQIAGKQEPRFHRK